MAWLNVSATLGFAGPCESDVAVADLGEPQCGSGLLCGPRSGRTRDMRDHFTSGDRQHHGRAEPGTVADELTSGHPRGIVFGAHLVTTTVPVMNGWIEQM